MNFDMQRISEVTALATTILGFIGGLVLYFKPTLLVNANHSLDKWYSTRKQLKSFEIMRETDSFYFKYNKVFGTIMLIGTFYLLYIFFTELKSFTPMIKATPGSQLFLFWDISLNAFRYFVIIFSIAGTPVWLLLIFSPFTLQRLNEYMNRWISSRMWLMKFDEMHYSVDGFVIKNHKIIGTLVVLTSLLLFLVAVL
jgi:hypothetical protein